MTSDTDTKNDRLAAALDGEEYVRRMIPKRSSGVSPVKMSNPSSRIDGILLSTETQEVVGIYEIKCRNYSFSDIVTQFDCELIVDAHKLQIMQELSRAMRVPSYLFNYLMGDGVIYRSTITNDKGDYVCRFRTEDTSAPASMGGEVVRKSMCKIALDGGVVLGTRETKGGI